MNTEAPLRILGLVPYPLGLAPSQRFRLEQWQPYLKDEGIELELSPFVDAAFFGAFYAPGWSAGKAVGLLGAFARRLAAVGRARRFDAVVVHRAAGLLGPALIERLLSWTGPPLVFDFDDAIFVLHASEANRRFAWLKFPGKTRVLCRLSRSVVAANAFLAEYARRHARSVTVVPSSVDTERFHPRPPREASAPLAVGWTGSSTSQTHLEACAELLQEAQRRRAFVLKVHSDRAPRLPGVDFEWRPWTPENEAAELAQFDVGIMPMPDDEWARGKSAMKALLYMAVGIPAVCSAVGANRELIRHGENGLLATTPEEWLAALTALADDPGLRQRLGAAGRRTVEAGFSARGCAARFAAVLRDAVAPGERR